LKEKKNQFNLKGTYKKKLGEYNEILIFVLVEQIFIWQKGKNVFFFFWW